MQKNRIEDKIVGWFNYKMRTFTKYCRIPQKYNEKMTNNNLPWCNMK